MQLALITWSSKLVSRHLLNRIKLIVRVEVVVEMCVHVSRGQFRVLWHIKSINLKVTEARLTGLAPLNGGA